MVKFSESSKEYISFGCSRRVYTRRLFMFFGEIYEESH